jgi:hypothetical protein
VDLELKDKNEKPYHARAYPVPQSQDQLLINEVQQLVDFVILRNDNRTEWVCPMLTIAKQDKILRSLADLRELNKRIKRKPFPIPKINDLLQKLEGFYLATSWRLFIEEYSPDLQYIKGENNVVADARSHLPQAFTYYEDFQESFYALVE